MLTKALLKSIFPKAMDDEIDAFLTFGEQALKDAGILQGLNRLHYFLAQLGHESSGLTSKDENLNYSAAGLMKTWPSRFPTLEFAKKYERDPQKIANFVYGGRMGNVNPGDGYRYRGRGYIQLTGRETYREIGRIAGLDLENNPELASKPEHAVRIACAFWSWKRVNPSCDAGDFTEVTRKINGGTNGLPDRLDWLEKVRRILQSAAGTTTPVTPAPATPTVSPQPAPMPRPKPAPTPAPKPVDEAESLSNPAVLAAQRKLTTLGYYDGVIDGIYNQLLRTALWAFQTDEDLPQTGRLDDRTRKELNV
jgi:putative chitinase